VATGVTPPVALIGGRRLRKTSGLSFQNAHCNIES
jgi:hypothetical protein